MRSNVQPIMPIMKPLSQWICDRCDHLIASPEDGWLEWNHSNTVVNGRLTLLVHSYQIVHHYTASPLAQQGDGRTGCYMNGKPLGNHLHRVLAIGINHFLAEVDYGTFFDPDYETGPRIKDFRNWTETVRRLYIPYYEEARRYIKVATEAGDLEGENQIHLYEPERLRDLIVKFR